MERTEKELYQIANDLYAGQIFTNLHIHESERARMTGLVFMNLLFLNEEQREELKKEDAVLVYEYIQKAGPRSVNGYPTFTSCWYLSRTDYTRMMVHYKKIEEAMKGLEPEEVKEGGE